MQSNNGSALIVAPLPSVICQAAHLVEGSGIVIAEGEEVPTHGPDIAAIMDRTTSGRLRGGGVEQIECLRFEGVDAVEPARIRAETRSILSAYQSKQRCNLLETTMKWLPALLAGTWLAAIWLLGEQYSSLVLGVILVLMSRAILKGLQTGGMRHALRLGYADRQGECWSLRIDANGFEHEQPTVRYTIPWLKVSHAAPSYDYFVVLSDSGALTIPMVDLATQAHLTPDEVLELVNSWWRDACETSGTSDDNGQLSVSQPRAWLIAVVVPVLAVVATTLTSLGVLAGYGSPPGHACIIDGDHSPTAHPLHGTEATTWDRTIPVRVCEARWVDESGRRGTAQHDQSSPGQLLVVGGAPVVVVIVAAMLAQRYVRRRKVLTTPHNPVSRPMPTRPP